MNGTTEMRKSGLPQNTLVLVADGEKALFLVNQGDDQDMNLTLYEKRRQDNPPARDWASDSRRLGLAATV